MHRIERSPEVEKEVLKPNKTDRRPPQYNCSCACGCQCGCGGRGESDDGNGDDVDEPFLKGSEGVENLPPTTGFNFETPQTPHERERLQFLNTSCGTVIFDNGGFHHPPSETDYEELRRSLQARAVEGMDQGRAGTPDSMWNEAGGSGGSSMASSVFGGRSHTPHQLLFSVGSWSEGMQLSAYYFSGAPLRLTAQRRYCRGLDGMERPAERDHFYDYPRTIAERDLH